MDFNFRKRLFLFSAVLVVLALGGPTEAQEDIPPPKMPPPCRIQLIPVVNDFVDANGDRWGERETIADGGCDAEVEYMTIVAYLYGVSGTTTNEPTVKENTCGPCTFLPGAAHTGLTQGRALRNDALLCSAHAADGTFVTVVKPKQSDFEQVCR